MQHTKLVATNTLALFEVVSANASLNFDTAAFLIQLDGTNSVGSGGRVAFEKCAFLMAPI